MKNRSPRGASILLERWAKEQRETQTYMSCQDRHHFLHPSGSQLPCLQDPFTSYKSLRIPKNWFVWIMSADVYYIKN